MGSISSARLVMRLVKPQSKVEAIALQFPGTDIVLQSDSVSATAIRMQLGTRYGCLTAILDMLKVAIPTLIVRLLQPDESYYLVVAALGVAGHAWPIYYRFHGGRGESTILGGLLVVDPIGLLITTVLGWIFGWMTGNLLVLRWGFLGVLIPWFWFRTHDIAPVLYMVFINIAYWIAMSPEIKQYFEFADQDEAPTQEELSQFWGMGGAIGRVLDRYSIPALFKRGQR
jgi:glycerol-3-phosphate acyltransferase PlsY